MENKFFDFRGDEEFNLDEEYLRVFDTDEFKPADPGQEKLKDAEVIIKELGAKYVEVVSLRKYEDIFINLMEFLDKFRTESDEVKNMSEGQRSKLFGYGKGLFTSYQNQYGEIMFNFELSREEWKFIDHTLTRKMTYNGQELFNYWELYNSFIGPTREIDKQLPKALESFVPTISIQSLILLSHLIMKHEEKGNTKDFHNFRTVLGETAKMTKLFNAYGVMLERATNRFNNWVNALNMMDGYNNDDRATIDVNE